MVIRNPKDEILIRPTELADLAEIAATMRTENIAEIWASHRLLPERALSISFGLSQECYTFLIGGKPACVFGVAPDHGGKPRSGLIWLLASERVKEAPRTFLRLSRFCMEHFRRQYTYLHNYADARFLESIEWLKWLGAHVEDPAPFGVDGRPFHHFVFERGKLIHV